MFLKSLEIYGFKSFADKVNLEFSDGITSLLGPNGCGKSNIVDAIKWVLGEQSTKTLRAGRMEDVIFNGTDTRKPLQVAEVSLVISNEERHLGIEEAEVEIKRRIFRNGESEYYLNRNRVLLKNIRELFYDTGVGKSAYSILEQGKIDQILSSKPEDRRYIFEEAAGISRFKVQSIEAERKLAKTDENILQVETILKEVKRNYETKKNQAAKAISYRNLKKEQFSLEVDVQLSTLKSYLLLRESKIEQKERHERDYEAQKGSLSNCDQEIEQMQDQLRTLGSERITMQTELQRLDEAIKGKADKLDLLTQRFRDFLQQKDQAASRSQVILEHIERDTSEIDQKLDEMADIDASVVQLEEEMARNQKALDASRAMLLGHNEEIAGLEAKNLRLDETLEELSLRIKELTDIIVIQLEEKLKQSGYNLQKKQAARADLVEGIEHVKKTLEEQMQFLKQLTHTALSSQDLVERQIQFHQSLGIALGRIQTLFQTYEAMQPSFLDELISPEGTISEKHRLDDRMLSIRKQVQSNRERIAYLREENVRLSQEIERYQDSIGDQKVAMNQLLSQKSAAKEWVSKLQRSVTEQEYQYKDALKLAETAQERIYETQEDIRSVEGEVKESKSRIASLNADLKELILVIEEQSNQIRAKQNQKNERYEELQNLRSEKEKLELQIDQLASNVASLYTNFFDNYGKSLKEFEGRMSEETADIPVLKARLDEVRKSIDGMGYINQMAEEEFGEVKEQYDFLTKQLDDLNKAKADLDSVVLQIKSRSEELFLASYKQISQNFQEMFRRLFGGGRAELTLVDPQNVLESGIDILAQPPGKKLTHLALLSGGERSMTAVALLFATYLVKPSPFCILDEIDAALDDRNIGYFLSVLEEFARKSQFIIITHNKHTVMGSQTLLGVTQMEAGVSTMVSYRIGNFKGEQVILNEQQQAVSFDEEGQSLGGS
ncbi:condensin subunit Smc [Sphaerochaeta associata]|uniref:chromosome segregation SMC family protein n=1 Tax=Sphaerochaeta TaxID=399320 RepID=UPI000E03AA0B|nr:MULTISPECIES: AAA family ATPase [Sphaerochaeta]MDD3423126.1 AAA family ATPase [Sphaerochaeta sp.]MDX9983432.1 AAA family ATPase [Sphaerochaeta sp.]SMP63862.1 condensin subunit Smc [Sphaerochaeta associata]